MSSTANGVGMTTEPVMPLHVLARRLLWAIDAASPSDLREAQHSLRDISIDMGVKASERATAKKLAALLATVK